MNPLTWAILTAGYVGGVYILVVNRGRITLPYIVLLISIIVITVLGLYAFILGVRKKPMKNTGNAEPVAGKDSREDIVLQPTEQETMARPVQVKQDVAEGQAHPPKGEGRYGDTDHLIQISKDRTVRWVNNGITVRTPEAGPKRPYENNYAIGGKCYRILKDLTACAVNRDKGLYRDIHGRYVLDLRERYPIFDSYDAATEDRYYHWYLILEKDRMSMVYSDDWVGEYIIEDIDKLPETPYRVLQFWHYLDTEGILRLK